jgi:rod shape-determining protein MreD
MAVLWAAYGWASYSEGAWRAPVYLFALGLVQDLLAGGPLGLYALIYAAAYPISRVVAGAVSSATLLTDWGGFLGVLAGVTALAAFVAPMALDGAFAWSPWLWAMLSTALFFPLTRGLYMAERIG